MLYDFSFKIQKIRCKNFCEFFREEESKSIKLLSDPASPNNIAMKAEERDLKK